MLSPLAFELPAFLLGLLFGSFLNVCISRLPAHQSITKPRSHCPHCHATIRWYDNIPLLSYLLLRARCRHCHQPVSWRYPAVELTFGIWTSLLTFRLLASLGLLDSLFGIRRYHSYAAANLWINTVALAILGFLLLGLLVMDWRTHKLPDAFTLTGCLLGFILIFIQSTFLAPGQGDIHFDPQHNLRLSSPGSFVAKGDVFMTGPEHLVLGRLLAMVAAASLILLIRWLYKLVRHREGLGLGDAKLLAMIAAFLGFAPAMLAFFVGVVLCGAYAAVLIVRGRATATTRLPLGTFLCVGGLLAALVGTPLIAWYSSLL
jgi:leader peptidase (prepilin peptidase)/N-methyltransferase